MRPAQPILRVAVDGRRHRTTDRLGLLFELAQREQQAVGHAVTHGGSEQLRRIGAGAAAQGRRFVAVEHRYAVCLQL